MALETYEHDFLPGDPALPVLVLLHGTGGDRRSFAGLGPEVLPGAPRLALDGDVREGPMRRFFRRRGEGLYDMADLAARTAGLAAFLESAAAAHGFDLSRAVGIGYSNGANILANLALTGAGGIRHLVLMHPLIPFAATARPDLAGWRVLITAGRRDPIAPADLTARLGADLAGLGARVETEWQAGGHEVGPAELAAIRRHLAGAPAPTA